MSTIDVAGLKSALADVPGIASLTETIVGGRKVYGFDGLIAAVDMNATSEQVEAAIRNAAALRPASPASPAPAATPLPSAAPISPAPAPQAQGNAMSVTGAAHVGTSLKDMLTQRKAKIAAAHEKIAANFDKLDDATAALDSLGDKIGSEADDLKAMVGQFTNDLG